MGVAIWQRRANLSLVDIGVSTKLVSLYPPPPPKHHFMTYHLKLNCTKSNKPALCHNQLLNRGLLKYLLLYRFTLVFSNGKSAIYCGFHVLHTANISRSTVCTYNKTASTNRTY